MVNSGVRLTALAHGGGCGCKLAPSVLRDILAGMPAAAAFPDLLVGTETADDAAVYRLNDSQALVATTDFFTPVVDDPYDFGRIAATNALSDVYAMGGTPIMALALVGMPLGKLSAATVQRIVAGGASVCAAAGIPVAGGHSIDSPEPIYGLVALGLVHPDRVMRNSGGRAGDSLILTKGLGARRPHPATLFTTRAARLRSLAEGNTLADYLRFLANIVDAQAAAVAAVPLPALPSDEQIALATEHMMPPLGGQSLRGDAGFTSTLAWLMDHLDLAGAPEAARDAADSVRAMPDDERAILAADIMQGAYPIDRIAETLFVAAALQVHLSGQASQLDAASLQRSENGTCPACGGMPVSSLVVGWTQASKARYCSCALCATAWNHVRIKCIACGSTEGIAYYTIEGGDAAIGIETCTVCRSYIKHMQQHENQALDPVADDVATYALDLLAREQDFRRSSINPLFLTG